MMRQRLASIALSASLAAAACGGGNSPPGSPNPGDTGERITGNERLGWTQAASSASEVATFGYVAYVDNNRVILNGVACNPSSGAFQCSSRLPTMTAGAHTIELASYVLATGVESGRSAPIRVTLAAATAGPAPTETASSPTQTASDGTRLRLDPITDAIDAPTAIAFMPEGRVLVGARRGSIYFLPAADLRSGIARTPIEPAIELNDVYVTSAARGGVLDIALDPAFERTRFVYVLYTAPHADGVPRFTLARFRETGGRLGERLVILSGIAASADNPTGSIGFGRDGKLYAAFDDGGAAERSPAAGSYNGKILRLNSDGTTPDDQPSRSPIYMGEYRSPRGFDWHPVSGALWVADARSPDVEEIRVRQTRIPLPVRTGATSIAFYRGPLLPSFQGNLLVAAGEGRSLLRLRLDRRDSTRLVGTERLFQELAGAISALAVGPDGAIFLASDRGLFRVGPAD